MCIPTTLLYSLEINNISNDEESQQSKHSTPHTQISTAHPPEPVPLTSSSHIMHLQNNNKNELTHKNIPKTTFNRQATLMHTGQIRKPHASHQEALETHQVSGKENTHTHSQ